MAPKSQPYHIWFLSSYVTESLEYYSITALYSDPKDIGWNYDDDPYYRGYNLVGDDANIPTVVQEWKRSRT